jgi:hypothetical protein
VGRIHGGAIALVLATLALAAPAAASESVKLHVLSSAPDQVSGGDALVRVDGPNGLRDRLVIERNGTDVTGAFTARDGGLVGLVDGLRVGRNWLTVADARRHGRDEDEPRTALMLTNHPIEGPIFSGPHQYPFVCQTERAGLGQPLVDNHDGEGYSVLAADGSTAGWSRDCSATTVVEYLYRSTAGSFKALPDGPRPADMATTTLLDGRTVDYVVRREKRTINRFIATYAMLVPGRDAAAAAPDTSLWNRRLVYAFDGGVAIGHKQGDVNAGQSLYNPALSKGYAVAYSSGTRTNTHYNLQLGGETALMTKEAFVERYGVPLYTVGVGGSGGGIQQYVYGQNHPGLIDAGVPQYSYPDMTTQTIHVGDCELLERYMDSSGDPTWANWENRKWLEGLNASATVRNPYTGNRPGSTECIAGWRGLTPLALNPLWHSPVPEEARMAPAGVMDAVHWTHWEDAKTVYGVDPATGYARQAWDNVGVQYGLQALVDGHITPEEFLDVNAKVGSWKDPQDMVQEGQPFMPTGGFDPWSARNMRLSPDGGVTPAPRRTGDLTAMRNAYRSGLYFDGDVDIPLIDWRNYLEEALNMHNAHQSFASRQRMLDHDGDASNQLIWFTDARPSVQFDQTPEALAVIDEWMANMRRHPERSVARNKPADAVDACFTTRGELIAKGPHVWDGILDHRAPGACTLQFPLHSTSRIVAGGPLRGGVYKCALQSVDSAIARGLYGDWSPMAADVARLRQIFPTGVCDYSKPDRGRPRRGDHGRHS